MNKDFAERWVADLRDPNNKQCQSVLHDGVGYCCLGRALVVGGFKLVPKRVEVEGDEIETRENELVIDGTQHPDGLYGESENLDDKAMNALGFDDSQGSPKEGDIVINGTTFESLADANDKGATFVEIADWVEKNLERL